MPRTLVSRFGSPTCGGDSYSAFYGKNLLSDLGLDGAQRNGPHRQARLSQEPFSITRRLMRGRALRLNALDIIQGKLKALSNNGRRLEARFQLKAQKDSL